MIDKLLAPCWRVRHWLWDRREHRTAREVLRYLAGHEELFIHERGNRAAVAVVRRTDGSGEGHTHIDTGITES